jgi:outer membrane protein W
MMRVFIASLLMVAALPLAAERRLELIVDVEGVHRQERISGAAAGESETTYEPEFDNGGGVGVGLNWRFTDRTSLEVKAAVLASDMRIRVISSDFVAVANVGYTNMIPISAVVQWHPFEGVALRPYIGAGVAHIIVEDIEAKGLVPATEFSDTTGLVLNAGLRVAISKRWSLSGDARYIPVETSGAARFGNQETEAELAVRPLIVGFGVVYRF